MSSSDAQVISTQNGWDTGTSVNGATVHVAGGSVTVTVDAVEVEPLNPVPPEYTAVMLCEPAAAGVHEIDAMPPETACAEPIAFTPSMNWTVPTEPGDGLTD